MKPRHAAQKKRRTAKTAKLRFSVFSAALTAPAWRTQFDQLASGGPFGTRIVRAAG